MPSLTKTLVCLAATCNGFLAPAPQRPATVLQAATIAAKDVSALRKASGPDPVQKMQKTAPSNWSRWPLVAVHRSAAATPSPRHKNKQHETQAPA